MNVGLKKKTAILVIYKIRFILQTYTYSFLLHNKVHTFTFFMNLEPCELSSQFLSGNPFHNNCFEHSDQRIFQDYFNENLGFLKKFHTVKNLQFWNKLRLISVYLLLALIRNKRFVLNEKLQKNKSIETQNPRSVSRTRCRNFLMNYALQPSRYIDLIFSKAVEEKS